MKKLKYKIRPLYDDLYSKIEELVSSSCYKTWLADVKKHYEKFGIPIPEEPIPRSECLCHPGEWDKKMFEKHEESINSQEYKDALRKANENKEGLTRQEVYDLTQQIYGDMVLHPIGDCVDFVIEECGGINRFNDSEKFETIKKHLINRILHGEKEYKKSTSVHFIRLEYFENEPTILKEITATTKRDDISNNWSFIMHFQKRLKEHSTNNGIKKSTRFFEMTRNQKDIGKIKKKLTDIDIDPDSRMFVEITKDTVRNDILEKWDFIKANQERLREYKKNFREKKNLKRDVRIMEIYNEHKGKNRTTLLSKIQAKLDIENLDKTISFEAIEKVIEENLKNNK